MSEVDQRSRQILEALRIEHQRRIGRPSSQCIPEPACAKGVDDVHLAGTGHREGHTPRTPAKKRVGRTAIKNRRASPVGQRERQIRDVSQVDARRRKWVGRCGATDRRGRRRDQRDLDITRGKVAHQVIHGTLKAPVAMQRTDGSGDDGDPQVGRTHDDSTCR